MMVPRVASPDVIFAGGAALNLPCLDALDGLAREFEADARTDTILFGQKHHARLFQRNADGTLAIGIRPQCFGFEALDLAGGYAGGLRQVGN